jgi:FixJ family two-component response regulator/anti-sigma regulatory factor (Ser/Thr protein kinase)
MQQNPLHLRPYLNTLTLLCVENSTVLTAIYEDLFSILFKEVIFVKNAEDGLDICQNNQIDIIITAQVFTGISGMDMIREIRKNNRDIPIIFVSSFEDIQLLTEAIKLRVTNFVKKPFETTDILDAIENATKQLLAKKYILEKEQEELNALKRKVDYSDYQEKLSFQKALKMIRNDFYYQHLKQTNDSITTIDFLYTPRDVISGDTYSARKINEDKTLLVVIDGMGKGLSASISALMAVSFLNRRIDVDIKTKKSFCLKNLISKTIEHTQKILLDEEILSISFVLIDTSKEVIEYASFSMPQILLQNTDGIITKLKSNNPPLNVYIKDFKTEKLSCKNIEKVLIYSDGLVENSLKDEDDTYSKYILEDFKTSITREDLRKKIISRIGKQEDDITFIFINHISLKKNTFSLVIDAKLEEIEKANEWFDDILTKKTDNKSIQSKAGLAFMELIMNAYEHGSLSLGGKEKHKLIENDKYFDFLSSKELTCKKKIYIDVYDFLNHFLVKIEDEGKGFNTDTLSSVFGVNKNFNRRGIFMSRNATQGIYYNSVANQISFIIDLTN